MTDEKESKEYVFSEEYTNSENFFQGDHVKVDSLLDKEIRILGFIPCSGDKGAFIGVNVELIAEDNKPINFSISGIVEEQIRKAEKDSKLPMRAKIVQKESKSSNMKYYSLA